MLARLRTRLSYANVIATIALFVALGGTGYAAAKIGSAQITNNSVKSVDVKNRSLLRKDFKGGQVPAGRTGPAGPAGANGSRGEQGPPGTARAYARVDSGLLVPGLSKGVIDVRPACPGSDPGGCASPPAPVAATDYCFKLGFSPKSVMVTPAMGRSYAPDAAHRVEGNIPGREYESTYGGCAPGYTDAEVRAFKEAGDASSRGFFVIFN